MQPFGLYLVITDPATGYETCARAAVKAGTRFIQLRMKRAPREAIVSTGHRLRAITAGTGTLLIVNDDPDIAAEVNADGVHLGQSDMPVPQARLKYPTLRYFGLSTHSFAQSLAARDQHPDYIGVGPVYATPTKAIPDPVLGPLEAGRMIKNAPFPAVAIGGIDETRLPEVLLAGAQNYSVVRAVCASQDPYAAILRLQAIWRENLKETRSGAGFE